METYQAGPKAPVTSPLSGDAQRALTFNSVFEKMILPEDLNVLCQTHAPVPRTPPKLTASQLVGGLVYHQLRGSGTLAQNAFDLHQINMSESAFSQRRQGLPQELFDQITEAALRALADPQTHPQAFYKGLRLVGLDGTQCSVSNTPRLLAAVPKAASRRLQAAFGKLQMVTLIELGLHNPLAAAVAGAEVGEATLAKKIWRHVPENSLLLIDRRFGTTSNLHAALEAWEGKCVQWLARIRKNINVKLLERLADGSALVEAPIHETDAKGKRVKRGLLRMREINYAVTGRDGKRSVVRLWTSLLDSEKYPAAEVAGHYAQRWEHEVAYREMKLDVRSTPLLASHTLETARQEVLAVVLAMAVVTRMRIEAGETLGVTVLGVSFLKVLQLTRQLWESFAWSEGAGTPELSAQLCAHYFASLRRRALLPPRRARSCPRAIRQTISSWPRKNSQPCTSGMISIYVLPMP